MLGELLSWFCHWIKILSIISIIIAILAYAIFQIYLAVLRIKVEKAYRYSCNTRRTENGKSKKSIAFYHPFCNASGGGEKVLWCMIDALFSKYSSEEVEVVIYSTETVADIDIIKRAEDRFNIKFGNRIPRFIQLSSAKLIKPESYPYFTILGQIYGTVRLAIQAMKQYQPDVFIDSMGAAFSYSIVKRLLPSCKVFAYVHYPFISMDMLDAVLRRGSNFNNSTRVADSRVLSYVKYIYYKLLIHYYGKMGRSCDYAWANSTWTFDQMERVWPGFIGKINKLYPPCSATNFLKLNLEKKENIMMSFAQFRPEKNHRMQLDIFSKVLKKHPTTDLKFYIVGSCRGSEDEVFLADLKKYANRLKLQDKVTFWVNLPFNELMQKFEVCRIGIHTMKAEHFGIAIVEMMASGLLTIAHNSAGPKYDIIKARESDPVGFLAETANDYIDAISLCIDKDNEDFVGEMVKRARKEVGKFSDEVFKEKFLDDFTKNT